MRSYETARSLFSFLAFCAWSMVVIGVIAAFVGMGSVSQYSSNGAGLIAALPGLAISLFGLFQVAIIQNARATVDTAEYTQQMLKISRDQLRVSEQSLKQGDAFQKSYTALNKETKETPKSNGYSPEIAKPEKFVKPAPRPIQQFDKQIQYQGHTIISKDKLHRVNNAEFRQIEHAKEFIDMLREKEEMTARIAELSAVAALPSEPVIISSEPEQEPMLLKVSAPIDQPQEPEGNLIRYNGKVIEPTGDKFKCNGIPFSTLSAAKNYVDNFASVPPKVLPGVKRP